MTMQQYKRMYFWQTWQPYGRMTSIVSSTAVWNLAEIQNMKSLALWGVQSSHNSMS